MWPLICRFLAWLHGMIRSLWHSVSRANMCWYICRSCRFLTWLCGAVRPPRQSAIQRLHAAVLEDVSVEALLASCSSTSFFASDRVGLVQDFFAVWRLL
ncbi:hypothetical protein K458DRAFT_423473, partial [Lentithecium fluviatile CBS 122367]